MTLRLAFDQIVADRPEPNLLGDGSLCIGTSIFMECIQSHDLRTAVELVLTTQILLGAPCLYPVGLYQIPSVWAQRWLADTPSAAKLRDDLLRLAETEGLYLVLDNCGEATDEKQVSILVDLLNRLGYPPHRAILLTSNPVASELTDSFHKCGMLVFGAHFFEAITRRFCMSDLGAIQAVSLQPGRIPERIFLTLNRRPKWYRLLLAAITARSEWGDDTFLSFGGMSLEADSTNWMPEIRLAINAAETLSSATICEPEIMDFVGRGALNLDRNFADPHETGILAYQSNDSAGPYFLRSFMSVVTESSYTGDIFGTFLTEKIFKAIAFCHPFILFSAPGALAELHALGYVTFSPWINEDYDEIENPTKRFDATISAIRGVYELLRSRDPIILQGLHEIARHNHVNLFRDTTFRLRQTLIDLERALSRMRVSGRGGSSLAVAIPEGEQAGIRFSTTGLVKLISGFYGLEGSVGRWCGSVGKMLIHVPRGTWSFEFRFGQGTHKNPPIFMIRGVRLQPNWSEGAADTARFEIRSTGGGLFLKLHSRSVYVPSEKYPESEDNRMLGFWLLDEFLISRLEV